ncbi:MAG TPA: J domain-containing protein [Pirellulaceae bacterium]|nr:J domain-containing protein [Pirellulaceae bacterium]
MSDPYTILGVSRTADDVTIRTRYLELVREFPPERAPERFAVIREAYDRLRDPVVSLENRLFEVSAPFTFESIVADARPDVRRTRLPSSLLLSLARS